LGGDLTAGGGATTTGAGAGAAGSAAGATGAGVGVGTGAAATKTEAVGAAGLALPRCLGGLGALRSDGIATARSVGVPVGTSTVLMSEIAARTATDDRSGAAGWWWPRKACAEMPTTNAPAAPAMAIQRSA
jgi:hypothetical protein